MKKRKSNTNFFQRINLKLLLGITIIVPLSIITVLLGFKTYNSYNSVKDYKNYMKLDKLLSKLNGILNKIGQERGTTSISVASPGGNFLFNVKKKIKIKEVLYKKREELDKLINEFFQTKEIKEINDPYIKNIINNEIIPTLNSISSIRKTTDIVINNNNTLEEKGFLSLFNSYNNVTNKLKNASSKIISHIPYGISKQLLLKYEELLQKTDVLGETRGYIAYYIVKNKALDKGLYKDLFIKDYPTLDFKNLKDIDKTLYKKITPIYNKFKKQKTNDKYIDFIFDIQETLQSYYSEVDEADNPKDVSFYGYSYTVNEEFSLYTQTISIVHDIISKILEHNNKIIDEELKNNNNKMLLDLFMLLFSIITLSIIFIFGSKTDRYLKEISDLLDLLNEVVEEDDELGVVENKNINIETEEGLKLVLDTIKNAIKVTQESKEKSEQAVKSKSLFLANMSHEIRTPLNGIIGFLELLEGTEVDEEQKEYIETIKKSSESLLQIVNNILDVSKIESNKVTIEDIEFKFIDTIENTLEIFATPSAQKNIKYIVNIDPDIPNLLKGDVLKIKEIFTNLVNNAIKFTPEEGSIIVNVKTKKKENGKITIYSEIEDSGIGMSEEQRRKVFEPFSQADKSVSRKFGGTGLGLTIVKSYIEMMGGYIDVKSEINKGTTFFFEVELGVVKDNPKYEKNSLLGEKIIFLQPKIKQEVKNAEARLLTIQKYLDYLGIEYLFVEDRSILENKLEMEKDISFVGILWEETSKAFIKSIKDLKIPKVTFGSYFYKEEIEEMKTESVYDPSYIYKITSVIEKIKNDKNGNLIKKQEKKKTEKGYNLHVLIAEDNPINQKLLNKTLQNLNITADIAGDGIEAVSRYRKNNEKYDIIFMDVQMPNMDGTEATQEILEFEKEEELPHTAIIAVTANALKGDKEKFLGAGMDDYVSKPINRDELINIIEKSINKQYKNIIKSRIDEEDYNTDEDKSEIEFNKYDKIYIISPKNYTKELKEKGYNGVIITIPNRQTLDKILNSGELNESKILFLINCDSLPEKSIKGLTLTILNSNDNIEMLCLSNKTINFDNDKIIVSNKI